MTSEAILEVPGVVKHFENYFAVAVTSEEICRKILWF